MVSTLAVMLVFMVAPEGHINTYYSAPFETIAECKAKIPEIEAKIKTTPAVAYALTCAKVTVVKEA